MAPILTLQDGPGAHNHLSRACCPQISKCKRESLNDHAGGTTIIAAA